MGLACMRGLVEKFGEKLINRALDIFEELLEQATESTQTVGICQIMFNMASASNHRLLGHINTRLISILEDNLSAELEEVRHWSTRVFITLMQRIPDKKFIVPTLQRCVMNKLKNFVSLDKKAEAETLIISLKQMIMKAVDLKL